MGHCLLMAIFLAFRKANNLCVDCLTKARTRNARRTDSHLLARRFDVPTFFGRELVSSREFASAWYGSALTPPRITVRPNQGYSI